MKTEMDMDMQEDIFTSGTAIVFLAYNYKQSVSIVLSPEAEEAINVPSE